MLAAGGYHAGLGGQAKVTQTGRTYDITGTTDGLLSSGPLGESGDLSTQPTRSRPPSPSFTSQYRGA